MTAPNEPPKPKRNYTVTERVLAACRINAEKARKVALERRFCATRGTDAEHKASHASLEAAQRVKREDNTYKYCSVFRHGLLVADLERSLLMAGESREEYQAHLARFSALPAVLDLDAASEGVKLAQACGFASWRRLRALRLQSEWALRTMTHHLHADIRIRSNGGGIGTPACADFVAPADGAQAGVALLPNLVRSLPGPPFDLTPERFVELGRELRHAAESWPSVWQPMTKLNNRFHQLWCTLTLELGEPEPQLNRFSIPECAHMRVSPIVDHYWLYSAEILAIHCCGQSSWRSCSRRSRRR